VCEGSLEFRIPSAPPRRFLFPRHSELHRTPQRLQHPGLLSDPPRWHRSLLFPPPTHFLRSIPNPDPLKIPRPRGFMALRLGNFPLFPSPLLPWHLFAAFVPLPPRSVLTSNQRRQAPTYALPSSPSLSPCYTPLLLQATPLRFPVPLPRYSVTGIVLPRASAPPPLLEVHRQPSATFRLFL